MKFDWRIAARSLTPAVVLALWGAASLAFLAATLEAAERASLLAWLAERAAPLVLIWLVVSAALGWVAQAAWLRWVVAPARSAELTRAQLQSEMAEQVRAATDAASRETEAQRSRLAALMSQLPQSVVVCNLDGRVLLYNTLARIQFRALSATPSLADGAELIGLGRSIYGVFDRKLVAHALENIGQRLQRGAAQPSAQFVTTTRGGQLLRAQMAPVLAQAGTPVEAQVPAGAADQTREISGFVLMLDNITRDFAEASRRDRLLHELSEGSRSSLGNLQAAVEMLDFTDLDAATRERFLGVIRDEVRSMSARLFELASHSTQTQKTRWPLEDMLGADLVAAAKRRIEALYACRVVADLVDASLWLNVDSFSLLQALVYVAGRLVDEHGIKRIELRLAAAGPRAHLDLLWVGQPMSTETAMNWESDPIRVAGENSALSVRDVVDRHGGEFWFERERVRQAGYFRFLLPQAAVSPELEASSLVRSDSRPEYYDFDLFKPSEPAREWSQRRLVDLTYTVFDTETTGLDPSAGDEIIQIGATRIVSGKLRRHESFEQLVNPGRTIPAASIPIHGIRPEMVIDAPTLDAVLPAFHAFVQDTVLVAHNAAFDMRFLQLKEAAAGIVFDQPVLDTLLLSAVVHPQQQSHSLEAIAVRLDVPVLGRHTALGDAIVTAEVFLKLIPLLAEMDIHTLGQARAAAQKTFYARLHY